MLDEQQRLEALKTIAETLNQCHHKEDMIQKVLQKLVYITHFESGWVFLENGFVRLVADEALPPALTIDDKAPMCGEDCYCVSKYKQGTLTTATNILNCKRIEKSIQLGKGDTRGITHHATVPLKTPDRSFGLLNVATPHTSTYKQSELDLIEAVAFQMGTALQRMEQFEREEQRANFLNTLHALSKNLREAQTIEKISTIAIHSLHKAFPVSGVSLRASGEVFGDESLALEGDHAFELSDQNGQLRIRFERHLSELEEEMIELAVEYIDLSFRNVRLQEREKDMARFQERARLAQDLHDSVNQLLFSVVLTAKGAKSISKEKPVKEQLAYIQTLTSDALQEMRTLIQRLKPHGLEEGVLAGLKTYAEKIGLTVALESSGTTTLPYTAEETLWRIGQEALHNAKKHSMCQEVALTLSKEKNQVVMTIEDKGKGFDQDEIEIAIYPSYGVKGMVERAELVGGHCDITSQPGEGTTVTIAIPFKKEEE
ncbi:GAF domain-containing protein [Pontibacillus yanchengensis]|uniref:GAF domain-containing protein n=2 Tax=Pontibacillus yanchengensis TaxID=462910 RepID=A0ACC7VCC5_9BACI|nr:GAF domain-containing sensor histidine kinase [Pontibacillus yanchengensis]MYL32487.1 GAF domain-containing protein [Pontibacillus yanchengensis]MYL53068.1 GAF domain-containing protein [Pontibacillus yanchengensis]